MTTKSYAKLILLVVVALMVFGGSVLFTKVVPPGYVAVKQVKLGINPGYHDGYDEPSRYIKIPFKDNMHLVSQRLQSVEMLQSTGEGLAVPTLDGQKVISDVVIVWSVFPNSNLLEEADAEELAVATDEEASRAIGAKVVTADEVSEAEKDDVEEPIETLLVRKNEMETEADFVGYHGGPKELFAKYGVSPTTWAQRMKQTGEDAARRALGRLSTDEYYHPVIREIQALLAQRMLNQGWEDEEGIHVGWHAYGVHVHGVLIRAYDFPPSIDTAIEAKVTQVQTRLLRIAEEEREVRVAEVQKASSEGDANKRVKVADGEAQAREILAEALQYARERQSEGDLLVKQASAKVTKAEADVLNMNGGALFVARELADLPKMVRGGILTDSEPLDLDYWLNLVNASGEAPDAPAINRFPN